ncbi:hypothetical protein H0N95_01790, partial [Candidatus Micrarchaeota archaeon]|nr:hypothetical protein [Candidatus Micrarchaeota archaeon]
DNNASVGVPRQKYEKILSLAEAFERYEIMSCDRNLDDVYNRVSCVQSMSNIRSVYEGVKAYNMIVSLDKHSLLNEFEELHSEVNGVKELMESERLTQLSSYGINSAGLERVISKIDNENIGSITSDAQETINVERSETIASERSGSFSERVLWLKDDSERSSLLKKEADSVFSVAGDDHLFLSTQKTTEVNAGLEQSIKEAENIRGEASALQVFAEQKLARMLEQNQKTTDSLYIAAEDYYERARYEKTGDAINDFAEGIRMMNCLSSEKFDFGERAQYAERLASSLESAGYDVSFEKNRIAELQKANTVSAAKSAYAELERIIASLKEKMKPMIAELRIKKEKSRSLINNADALLSKYFTFDVWQKTETFRSSFRVSLAKDEHSNFFELSSLYDEIISYYKSLFYEKAKNVLSENAEVKLFFQTTPECNRKTSADAALIVKNTLPITVENADIEKAFLNETLRASVFFLEPNKQAMSSKRVELTPLRCSAQQNDEINGVKAAKITIEPAAKLAEALVQFDIPLNVTVLSVFPPSEFNRTHYLARDVSEKQDVIIQYYLSNETSVVVPIVVSNASVADENKSIQLSNDIEDLCFFTECSDLRARQSNGTLTDADVDAVRKLAFSEIAGDAAYAKIVAAESLLKKLERAVDSSAEVVVKTDYSKYADGASSLSDELDAVKSMYNEFKSAGSDVFSQYSKTQIKDYISRLDNVVIDANDSINVLSYQAKTRLADSLETYKQNPDAVNEYLQKSKDEFDGGYYVRSLVYSDFITENFADKSSFPFEYVAVAGVLGGFGYYIFKKPKRGTTVKLQAERRLKSV